MALAIAAALLSGPDPRQVLLDVSGLTLALPFRVVGSTTGWSWPVQGAAGVVATSTQAVLVDVAVPLRAGATWTVVQGEESATTPDPMVVPLEVGDAVIQSLDGTTVAVVDWLDNGHPREGTPRQALYTPAGRSRPILHWDVEASERGSLLVETAGTATRALRDLVRAGAPVMLRTAVGHRDLDPVQVVAVTGYPHRLVGAVGDRREWDLSTVLVGDVEDTAVTRSTLADVNAVLAGEDLAAWNDMWTGATLADVNLFDWRGEA